MLELSRRDFLRRALAGGTAIAAGLRSATTTAAPISTKVTSNPTSVFSSVYYLGIAEGLFAKHEWNITELIPSGAGGAAIRTIATGGIPIGGMSATAAFQAWLVGAPIRIVTLCINKPTELLYVVKPGSSISKPEDLAGKKIGYTGPGSGTHAAATLALDRLGLTGKVELVATGGIREGLALLDRGEIDVASQLESIVKASDKHKVVFRVPDLVPKYAYGAIVVAESFAQKEPQRVSAFLAARSESVERVKKDPEAAANAWFKGTRGFELESLTRSVKAMNAAQGWITTGWDLDAVHASLRSMELIGSIPSAKNVPLAEMLDQTFIEPDRRIKI